MRGVRRAGKQRSGVLDVRELRVRTLPLRGLTVTARKQHGTGRRGIRSDGAAPPADRTTPRSGKGRREGPAPLSNRYVAFALPGGDAVVYDRENTHTWIQSDYALPLPGSSRSE